MFRKKKAVSPATLSEWAEWVIGTLLAIAKGTRDGKYTATYFVQAKPILQAIREGKPLEPVCAKLLKPMLPSKRTKKRSSLVIDCAAPAPVDRLHIKGRIESHDTSMGKWEWNPFQIDLYYPPDQKRPGFCFNLDEVKKTLAGRMFPNANVLQGLLHDQRFIPRDSGYEDVPTIFLGTIYRDEENRRYALSLSRAYPATVFSFECHWISERFYLDERVGHHMAGCIRIALYANIGEERGVHSLD